MVDQKKEAQKLSFNTEQNKAISSVFDNFEKMLDFESWWYHPNHLTYTYSNIQGISHTGKNSPPVLWCFISVLELVHVFQPE